MKTIYLLDDHEVFVKGLYHLLLENEISSDIFVFTSSQEFKDAFQKKVPDLVIVDQVLDNRAGIELLVEKKKAFPMLKAILISSSKDLNLLNICKDFGIQGYIFKSEPKKTILAAIVSILDGGQFYSEINQSNSHSRKSSFELNPFFNFTQQEIAIVRCLAKGLTQKEISLELDIALKTVNVHRNNIAKKNG